MNAGLKRLVFIVTMLTFVFPAAILSRPFQSRHRLAERCRRQPAQSLGGRGGCMATPLKPWPGCGTRVVSVEQCTGGER